MDREFGTGALKITPSHDIYDYALGMKHNLQIFNILAPDGTIRLLLNNNQNSNFNIILVIRGGKEQSLGEYEGLDRFACRERIWTNLHATGLAVSSQPHMQRVPRSQRGGEVLLNNLFVINF